MSELQPINFTRGVPAVESFPLHELAPIAAETLNQHGAAVMQYGPAMGFRPMREWIAEWQNVNPDEVLTGNGSLELFDFLCLQTLKEGDVVFTESPTYDRAVTLLRRHKATVVGIPTHPDGPDIAILERELQKQTPKFFYVIADFQNPSGATCSSDKRRRIIDLANEYGFFVVEDAPYRLLRYRGRPEPTLYSLDPSRTLHMSSFTKLLGPGVRLGFMLGKAELMTKVAKVAEDTYISPGYVAHGITYEWCRRGLLPPQIERLKQLYAPRLEACLSAINRYMPDAEATRPDGGFFLSVNLPPGISTTAVRLAAAKRNLNLADGTAFFPNGGGDRFLRLPYCALTTDQIDEGVRRLAETVAEVRRQV
jgi:2-aminoadipate transaminase